MTEGVFSFHRMQQGCRADEPAAWLHFLKNYAPLAKQLLRHYFSEQEQRGLLARVFREARADEAPLWRSFAGAGEKEFALHFRAFLLNQGRAARRASPETPLTVDNFWAVLQEFPPLQRELLMLAFHRYSPEELSAFLKFEPETIVAAVGQAQEKLAARLGAAVGGDLVQGDHDALFAAVEKQRGEACLPDKTHVRFVDGQLTWREREEVERHLESCFYCLNRFAEFREATHFFHVLPPADEAVVAELAVAMGLPAREPPKKEPSWWERLLGG
jgi:hypothetical protein